MRKYTETLTAQSEWLLKYGSLDTTPCLFTDVCLHIMSLAYLFWQKMMEIPLCLETKL